MREAIKSWGGGERKKKKKDCPVPFKRLRGNCILGSNFELNSVESSISLEGSSWRGMLDLGFLVIMCTHHWKVNAFTFSAFFFFDIGALCCGCVYSCKAHVIISPPKSVFLLGAASLKGVRLSLQSEWESLGLGSSVGREQQFRKKQMRPVAPVLGWCWADAELR